MAHQPENDEIGGRPGAVTLAQVIEAILVASPDPLSTAELATKLHAAAKAARDEERERIEEELGSAKGGKKPDESGVRDALRRAQAARPEVAFAKVTAGEVTAALGELATSYVDSGRAFTVLERAGGWKIFTRGEYAGWVRQLFPERKPERLSGPAMETLAIIAYRQPITKAAIEAVRGVSCDGVLQKLLDRNLVRISGRAELPGRPLLYETTDLFFEHFGIRSVDDLPNAAELRSVPLPEPAGEAPGDATPQAAPGHSETAGNAGEGGDDGSPEAVSPGAQDDAGDRPDAATGHEDEGEPVNGSGDE